MGKALVMKWIDHIRIHSFTSLFLLLFKQVKLVRNVGLYGFLVVSSVGFAYEVKVEYNNQVINADFEPVGESETTDHVVLILHGGLAHRDMENLVYLRSLLNDGGFSTLAINLSLGLNNRHGMYDCNKPHVHTNLDAVAEIDVWIQWLVLQGVNRITLLGHSRGGAQISLFANEKASSSTYPYLIRNIILMAPSTQDNGATGYEKRYDEKLEKVLSRAKRLSTKGKKNALIKANMMFCRDIQVSAQSFMSYYDFDRRHDTPQLLNGIMQPVLVIVAEDDQVVVDLEAKIKAIKPNENVMLSIIEDAGHFFRDLNMDEAVDVIFQFMSAPATLAK